MARGVRAKEEDAAAKSAAVAEGRPELKVLRGQAPSYGERVYKIGFMLPAVIVVLFLSIFPLVYTIVLAFTNLNFANLNAGLQFVGFENWSRLFQDPEFRTTLFNTVLYVLIGVPLQYGLGLGLALLLHQAFVRYGRLFRLLFLIPMMLTPVAVGFVIGRTIFNENGGPINYFLHRFGLPAPAWLSDPTAAFWVIAMVDAWEWTPFMMLLLLAGLQSLPPEPYEAARIDGASRWMVFRTLTFPMLWPVTVTAVLIRAVEVFRIIDIVQIITGGGPGTATESVTLYAFNTVFRRFDLGYAAAMAVTLLVIVVIVATVFVTVGRRRVAEA